MALSDRQRKYLRRAAYPVVGLITFMYAAFYTFPYDRLKDRIVSQLSAEYDVSIDSISPTPWLGKIKVKSFILKTRPEDPEQKPDVFIVDEVGVNVSLLGLLRGKVSADIDASIGGGSVEGSVSSSDSVLAFELATREMPLAGLPGIRTGTSGVPIQGGLNANLSMTLPHRKWKEAEGEIKLACSGCVFGDGVSKMMPRAIAGRPTNAFTEQGVTVPRLRMGEFEGLISVHKGVGKIEKFQASSPDGEMFAEGSVQFADPFKLGSVNGCMKLKFSDDLKQRDAHAEAMERGFEAARRDDGYIGITMSGTFTQLMFKGYRRCTVGGAGHEGDLNAGTRPRVGRRGGLGDPFAAERRGGPAFGEATGGVVPGTLEPAPPPTEEGTPPAPTDEPPPIPEPGSSGPPLGAGNVIRPQVDDVALDPGANTRPGAASGGGDGSAAGEPPQGDQPTEQPAPEGQPAEGQPAEGEGQPQGDQPQDQGDAP